MINIEGMTFHIVVLSLKRALRGQSTGRQFTLSVCGAVAATPMSGKTAG